MSEQSVQARILCYHRICDDPNPNLATFAMRPADFRAQMQFLRDDGWHVIALSEMLEAFQTDTPLNRAVVLTFDDGYQDLVDTAMPILREFGYPATAFIVSDLIGKTAEWDTRFGGEMGQLATLDGLKLLEQSGWELGHHTRSHARLTSCSDDDLRNEIAGGKEQLETLLGHSVPTFAYPFGVNDQRVRDFTRDAGFPYGFALDARIATNASDPYGLERVCVLREHTLDDLESLLVTGWDVQHAARFS